MLKERFKILCVFFISAFVFSLGAIFSPQNFRNNLSISPAIPYYRNFKSETDEGFLEDETEFVFSHENKIWKYRVKDNLKSANIFDINYKLNKFNNDKNKKINEIKYLINLKYSKKDIINYIFPNLINLLEKIEKNIEIEPKNANFSFKNGKLQLINEIVGKKINFDLFFDLILNNYFSDLKININIPIITIFPEIRTEKLKREMFLRSSFTTSYKSSSDDRKHNIAQAARSIHGKTIKRGERFSFNNMVGRRTASNGYRTAKIIVGGEFVDGVGGGVCQVSTTLYNAVLKAGLKIIQANKHSEKISYVQDGFDAMVNFGSSDLIFENNTGEDLHIFCIVKNETLTIKIYGESLNGYEYRLRSEKFDIEPCGAEKIIFDVDKKYVDKVKYNDEFFYLKRARDGYKVKTFRDVYFHGDLVKIELIRTDKYSPQNAIVVYGAEIREEMEDEPYNI